jgi:UDPglucose--hexose-1-phosphate uridylyltransferase
MSTEPLPRHELHHADGRGLWLYGAGAGGELPTTADPSEPSAIHLRHDALTDRWVAISPARNTRPHVDDTDADDGADDGAADADVGADGGDAVAAPEGGPDDATVPSCPLCPGGPEVPWPYEAAVFENRWPTLVADPPPPPVLDGPTAPARGRCEVVLYTSTHEGSLATLTNRELARVVAIWTDRTRELWRDPAIRYVLPFENRGDAVGATLPHPHGQIYALDHVPRGGERRVDAIADHRARHGSCLHCEVVARDSAATGRTVALNPSFTVAVPFAPDWPFEVHVRARRHGVRRLTDLTSHERHDLCVALRDVVLRYDRFYDDPMAYLMVAQESPRAADDGPVDDWHLSFEFLPPHRAPHRLKVRASVETAAGLFINDTVPEVSAATLAAVDTSGANDDEIPDVRVETHHAGVAAVPGVP